MTAPATAYQVLARKWRPRDFASLVGQEHVVRALTHALDTQRLHHAYLFTGTRGVGKTTIARILAKSLNCETGVTSVPCGKCSACREIDAGRFVDLLEVDAATNTRVDEMRQLLDNAVYAPTRGRFKVYVIDEVHMLSNSAFNAMLKTLEEPPEHVKFILATTDPQKIPVTVLSRCLQFNLKQMPIVGVRSHLARILAAEGIEADPAALALVARSARGSMRDALSLLDQAIAFTGGRVNEAEVRAMLGTVDRDHLFGILDGLAIGDLPAAVAISRDMEARSIAFDGALEALAGLLYRIALVQADPATLDRDEPDHERVAAIAGRLDRETVQLFYQIVLHGRADLALAPDEAAGFTMTLIRMAAFEPSRGGARESARQAAPTSAAAPSRPVPTPNTRTAPLAVAPAAASIVSPVRAAPSTPPPIMPRIVTTAPVLGPITPIAPTIPTVPELDPAAAPEAEGWPDLVRSLGLTGFAKQLGERSELVSREGHRFALRLPPSARQLAGYQDKLRAALEAKVSARVVLEIAIAETSGGSVADQDDAKRASAKRNAEEVIAQDPFVRDLMRDFDATIESVKPTDH